MGSVQRPEAPLPRCVVHLERDILTRAPQRLRKRLAREVSAIFEANSRKDAKVRLARLKAGRESALRLITAVAHQITRIWADRRCLYVSKFDVKEKAA